MSSIKEKCIKCFVEYSEIVLCNVVNCSISCVFFGQVYLKHNQLISPLTPCPLRLNSLKEKKNIPANPK